MVQLPVSALAYTSTTVFWARPVERRVSPYFSARRVVTLSRGPHCADWPKAACVARITAPKPRDRARNVWVMVIRLLLKAGSSGVLAAGPALA